MDKILSFITRVQVLWVAVGSFLIVIGGQLNLPDWVSDVFSQQFIDNLADIVGAILIYLQYLKGLFASKIEEGAVAALDKASKLSYLLPWKLKL